MIHNPQSGGIHLPALTNPAGAGQILSGYQAINADGEIVTGSIPSQGAQTITPGTSNKTITAGRYLSGTQTIAGDSDLVAGNIKSGINLFGVDGNLSSVTTVSGRIDVGSVTSNIWYQKANTLRMLNNFTGYVNIDDAILHGFIAITPAYGIFDYTVTNLINWSGVFDGEGIIIYEIKGNNFSLIRN